MENDFMSFRRALLGLSLCCAAPNVALAQQTRQVEISYDITFLGFTGFRIDFSGTFTGGTLFVWMTVLFMCSPTG